MLYKSQSIKLFYILLPLCFIACTSAKQQSFNFDESKTVVDLLALPGYEVLNKDEQYKEYITDFFESSLNLYKKNPVLIELMASPPEVDQNEYTRNMTESDNAMLAISMLPELGKWFGKGILSSPGFIKYGIKLVMLENKQKKLYVSFSEDKKAKAKQFDKEVVNIIKYYNSFFENEVNAKISYKYLKPSLKEDKEAMKLIEPVLENADKFFIISMEVKTKVAFNHLLSEQPDTLNYSRLVDYGILILSSNSTESISIDTPLLNDYYNALNKFTKSITELENADFKVPVEDWSKPKRASYEFLINNLKEKTLKEIKSINEFNH